MGQVKGKFERVKPGLQIGLGRGAPRHSLLIPAAMAFYRAAAAMASPPTQAQIDARLGVDSTYKRYFHFVAAQLRGSPDPNQPVSYINPFLSEKQKQGQRHKILPELDQTRR